MKSSNNLEEIKKKFNALLSEKNLEEGLKHDALILMSSYLSEIDRISQVTGLNRGELAEKINVSGSYLTQVFRGKKPLNFYTIAKIQRALNVRFNVTATLKKRYR